MRDHIYRYRKARGKQHRFVVRRPKPGWSRALPHLIRWPLAG
jgi:hypothetical protein